MQRVEIRVKGRVDERWLEWLGNVTITHTEQGESVLVGAITDQAALYGLVSKLADLGMPLVSVNPLDDADQKAAPAPPA